MFFSWCYLEALLSLRAPCIIREVIGVEVDVSCALKSLQGMLYKQSFLSAVLQGRWLLMCPFYRWEKQSSVFELPKASQNSRCQELRWQWMFKRSKCCAVLSCAQGRQRAQHCVRLLSGTGPNSLPMPVLWKEKNKTTTTKANQTKNSNKKNHLKTKQIVSSNLVLLFWSGLNCFYVFFF